MIIGQPKPQENSEENCMIPRSVFGVPRNPDAQKAADTGEFAIRRNIHHMASAMSACARIACSSLAICSGPVSDSRTGSKLGLSPRVVNLWASGSVEIHVPTDGQDNGRRGASRKRGTLESHIIHRFSLLEKIGFHYDRPGGSLSGSNIHTPSDLQPEWFPEGQKDMQLGVFITHWTWIQLPS